MDKGIGMFKQGKESEETQSDEGQTKNGGRRPTIWRMAAGDPPPRAMATEVTQDMFWMPTMPGRVAWTSEEL